MNKGNYYLDAQAAMMINTPTPSHITFQKKKNKIRNLKKNLRKMSELRSYIFWYPAVVKKKKKERMYTMIKEKITHASTLAHLIRSAVTSIVVKSSSSL